MGKARFDVNGASVYVLLRSARRTGKGDETEGEEDEVDYPSPNPSKSEDLITVGIGGRLGEAFCRGSQPAAPGNRARNRSYLRWRRVWYAEARRGCSTPVN